MTLCEKILSEILSSYVERLNTGACDLTEDNMMTIIESMSKYDMTQKLSKDLACSLLGLSRSSFDDKIRCGIIPKGMKVRGFKELM